MPISEDLACIAKGEVLADLWHRQVYSVDASHYTAKPAAILQPLDEGDVQELCRYASRTETPLTARGAGTGLLGQSLSDNGIIIDFTRHMNRVLEIESDHVTVQPGIVKGFLDKELGKIGKFLPPDPASSNYCTIGGMIADNSSGAHCLGYGNTIDFLEEIDVVYADGSSEHLDSELNSSHKLFGEKTPLLYRLLEPNANMIFEKYPKVNKNSCGYRLDRVVGFDCFAPHKIFAASEGTLGLVTSAKMRILDIPLYRRLMVLGFDDVVIATNQVNTILEYKPVSLEMLDHTVIVHGENTKALARGSGCLLFVEFAGDSLARVDTQSGDCLKKLAGKCTVIEYASDESSLGRIWSARKGALNNVMKMTFGSRKPVGLIEDTVVPPSVLSKHLALLLETYHDNNLDYVAYGHAGDGNLHTRPLIDLSSKHHVRLADRIASEVFSRVIKSGGTITGEHGDGLARVGFIEMMYGKQIFSLFRKVKEIFDPKFLLNPGKKVPRQV